MKIFQSSSFAKKTKKLNHTQKEALDSAVREIISSPKIGVEKKGDLRGIFIHKFKIQGTLFLLSYRFQGEDLEIFSFLPKTRDFVRDQDV